MLGSSSGAHEDTLAQLLAEVQSLRREGRHGGGSWWPILLLLASFGFLVYRYRAVLVQKVVQQRAGAAVAALNRMGPEELKKALGDHELPWWISYPDNQRVEFLNTVMRQLWPYISLMAENQVKAMLPPLMEENKPSFIESLQMKHFTVGDQPPQLSGVKVFAHDENARPTDVTLEMELFWPSTSHASFAASVLPNLHVPLASKLSKAAADFIQVRMTLENLMVRGSLRVVLKPLANELPIVNALQISLTRQPKFSYDLDVLGIDVRLMPGLEPWLNGLLADSVLKPYVLPDKFVVPLIAGDVDTTDEPAGLLQVRVVEGEHIPSKDFFGASDPYLRLFMRAMKEQHTQEKHGRNVTWNETFRLVVHDDGTQALSLILMDADVMGQDDELGRAKLDVAALEPGLEHDLWVDIVDAKEAEGHDDSVAADLEGNTAAADAAEANRGQKGAGVKAGQAALQTLDLAKGNRPNAKPCRVHLQVTYLRFNREQRQVALDALTHGAEDTKGQVGERLPLGDPAREMLEAAVLQVRLGRINHLSRNSKLHVPFLGPKARVEVRCAGETRESKPVPSKSDPFLDQVLEFKLDAGAAARAAGTIDVALSDAHILGTKRGSVRIPLAELKAARRITQEYPVAGLPKVTMHIDAHWMSPLEAS